ncbi:hypothetical protein CS022_02095 [Veronia nyctiphanis]|uniref:Uncharacterized protein n=1 Tax=Veronia nyctiphanis TaxID=1278244 RepID=A0A4Q0YZ69_9GAMM|nr:hypothetical protein [Veronia nyctiphanis]RXJ74421.1 hypothetical protein CS022_02095 [Veronia nyctiphanis]
MENLGELAVEKGAYAAGFLPLPPPIPTIINAGKGFVKQVVRGILPNTRNPELDSLGKAIDRTPLGGVLHAGFSNNAPDVPGLGNNSRFHRGAQRVQGAFNRVYDGVGNTVSNFGRGVRKGVRNVANAAGNFLDNINPFKRRRAHV